MNTTNVVGASYLCHFFFNCDWCLEHLPQHHTSSLRILPLSGTLFSFPQGKFGLDWIRQEKIGQWLWSAYRHAIVKVKPMTLHFHQQFKPANSFVHFKELFLDVFYIYAHTLTLFCNFTNEVPEEMFRIVRDEPPRKMLMVNVERVSTACVSSGYSLQSTSRRTSHV